MKGLTKFKSQAAAAVLGSSFTRSNFQSEGVSCHPGVLALWPKITLRMKEKGCRDISYDACVTSNPNINHLPSSCDDPPSRRLERQSRS